MVKKPAGTAVISKKLVDNKVKKAVGEDITEEKVDVPVGSPSDGGRRTEPCAKSASRRRYTKNLGDYQSAKVGVSLKVPCISAEVDDVFSYASDWVNAKLGKIVEDCEVTCGGEYQEGRDQVDHDAWPTSSPSCRRTRARRSAASAASCVKSDRIPTGIFPLDLAMGGGLPARRQPRLSSGLRARSKTNIVLRAIAMHQLLWPDKINVFFDVENSFDPAWARRLGVDTDKLVVIKPELRRADRRYGRERVLHRRLRHRGDRQHRRDHRHLGGGGQRGARHGRRQLAPGRQARAARST